MKKILLFINILIGLGGAIKAQDLDEFKQFYSIDNPNESKAVKIIYADSIKPKTFNEVSVTRALSLFKLQKDRIEIDATSLTVLYNGTKIELFMPVDEVISVCKDLEFQTDTLGSYYYSKKNLIILRTVNYKGKKYIIEIEVDDFLLRDRKLKNYGIILVNNFPVTRNQDPNETHLAFNKKAINDGHQFSGYGRNWQFKLTSKSKNEAQLAIISELYEVKYFERLQYKSIRSQLKWRNASANKFIIECNLTGIDPEISVLEAPKGN